MSRVALRQSQEHKLRDLLREVVAGNAFYRRKLERAGIDLHRMAAALASEDRDTMLGRLPLTEKLELQRDQEEHAPYGTNLSYPLQRYSRLHRTSGTTGRPLYWLDTPETWGWYIRCWQQVYDAVGVGPEDRLFFPFSFGPFIGFWGGFESASRRGNLCLAAGGMTTVARLRFLVEHAVTVVGCTPTYALRLAEVAAAEGIDLASSPVRALVVAGEPGGSIAATRRQIESAWGARTFDHCGMTEMGCIGFECRENPGGMHVIEDEFIVEVLEPENDCPVAPGEPGELVLTNLGRPGSPLLRYRTGDLVRWSEDGCPCGRSFGRLEGGILGRVDDMFFVRGNNVYPTSVEAVVREFTEVAEYRLRLTESQHLTGLEIEIDPVPGLSPEEAGELSRRVSHAVRDRLLFRPEVRLVPPGSLPRFDMKARRLVRESDSPAGPHAGPTSGGTWRNRAEN